MAVYTVIDPVEAGTLLRQLGLGELQALDGILGGIENTNYFATTTGGTWVLTVFERLARERLPYHLGLMLHLAQAGLPVPWPQAAPDGGLVHTLGGKPAAVVTRLPGESLPHPDADACRQLGHVLARLHVAGAGFAPDHAHERGLDWWGRTLPEVLPYVPPEVAQRLRSELAHQQQRAATPAFAALPAGPIHADLFRDNALFVPTPAGWQLSGVFDFYFAGTDTFAFDLAVCLNDWCLVPGGPQLEPQRSAALMQGYTAVRPLTDAEHALLPDLLRAAALRFWISRLWDWYLPRTASLLKPKDPSHFEQVLADRIDNPGLPGA
jgi:homoserine kinase type II